MPSPLEIQFDNWGSLTLNNKSVATRLPPGHAQVVENVDLQDYSLVGQKDTSITGGASGVTANSNWIHYVSGAWTWDQPKAFAMNDADRTYVSKPGQTPVVYQIFGTSFETYPLGIAIPNENFSTGTTSGGVSYPAGTYSFRLTAVVGGLESNPSRNVDITFSGSDRLTITISSAFTSPSFFTGFNVYRKGPGETVYTYITQLPNVAQINTISYAATVTTNPQLTWDIGGQTESEPYVADHSAPPVLTCLADALYSIDGSVSQRGKGIAFGASGNSVRWSMKDFPEYWPSWARYDLAEEVESITATQGYVAVGTSSTWTKVEGVDHESLRFTQLPAAHYVRKGCGRSTVSTPYGIVFLAREGFCLFDGVQTKLITQDKLSLSFVQGLTVNQAAYFDGRYYLFHTTGTVVLDFRQGDVQVSTNTKIVTAAHSCDFTEPYIADQIGTHPGPSLGMRYVGLAGFPIANKLLITSGQYMTAGGANTNSGLTYIFDTANNSYTEITNGILSGPTKAWSTTYSSLETVFAFNGSTAYATPSSTGLTSVTNSGTIPDVTAGFVGLPGLVGGMTTYHGATFCGGSATGFNFVSVSGTMPTLTATWSGSKASAGYTRDSGAVAYVPGAVAGNTNGFLVAFGGFNGSDEGTATMVLVNLDQISNLNTATCKTIIAEAATQAGVYARGGHAMVYDSYWQRIYVFGGQSKKGQVSGTAYYADFWEFDPSTLTDVTSSITSTSDAGFAAFKARWKCSSKFVGNIEEASYIQMASDSGKLYAMAGIDGKTFDDRALYLFSPVTMQDCAQVPGLFVLEADSTTIKSWGTGANTQAWRWQTGEITGSNPSAYKTFQRYKIDYTGTIAMKVVADGTTSTVETLTAASRTEARDWMPSTGSNKPEGKRVSFLFEGSSNSVLYSVALEGVEDNG